MTVSPSDFQFVHELLKKEAAIVLEHGKEYLVETRLVPVVREQGLKCLEELIAAARNASSSALRRSIVEAMTTHETFFFRDLEPFQILRENVLPQCIANAGDSRQIRIWSAACSSGQEPYSVAMIILDHFPMLKDWKVEIIATDISCAILEKARTGHFNQHEVNRGLPASSLIKHFEKQGSVWAVKDHLKQMITFQQFNLLDSFQTLPKFDVVLLRNVLIYFDVPTKQVILKKIRDQLRPNGFLFLGSAESTHNIDTAFKRCEFGKMSVYQVLR